MFLKFGSNSEFLRDDRRPLTTQNVRFCILSLPQRWPLFCFWLSSACMPTSFQVFPICYPLLLLHLDFFLCLRRRNESVHKIVVAQWIPSSHCNVIFMTFMKSSFHTLSRRFVGFNSACVLCLALLFNATGFPVLFVSGSARHCCLHRNFQLPTHIFIISMNSSSAGSMKWIPRNFLAVSSFGFSIARFCFSLRFDASDIFPNFWPQRVWSGCRLLSCQSLPGPSISIRLFFSSNIVNHVKPVHMSYNSRSPSSFQ